MQRFVHSGIIFSVSDFTFTNPVADPTQLTFAVDDDTVIELLLHDDEINLTLGTVKAHGIAAGTSNLTATDNSSSGPQTSASIPCRWGPGARGHSQCR
jgi:hypothetical protein